MVKHEVPRLTTNAQIATQLNAETTCFIYSHHLFYWEYKTNLLLLLQNCRFCIHKKNSIKCFCNNLIFRYCNLHIMQQWTKLLAEFFALKFDTNINNISWLVLHFKVLTTQQFLFWNPAPKIMLNPHVKFQFLFFRIFIW